MPKHSTAARGFLPSNPGILQGLTHLQVHLRLDFASCAAGGQGVPPVPDVTGVTSGVAAGCGPVAPGEREALRGQGGTSTHRAGDTRVSVPQQSSFWHPQGSDPAPSPELHPCSLISAVLGLNQMVWVHLFANRGVSVREQPRSPR